MKGNSLRTSRKILGLPVPAAIAGGVVLVGGGVALAAVLLTTSIGGTLTVNNVGTSNSITVTGSSRMVRRSTAATSRSVPTRSR